MIESREAMNSSPGRRAVLLAALQLVRQLYVADDGKKKQKLMVNRRPRTSAYRQLVLAPLIPRTSRQTITPPDVDVYRLHNHSTHMQILFKDSQPIGERVI